MLVNQRQAQIQGGSGFAVAELEIQSLAPTHCCDVSDGDHFTQARALVMKDKRITVSDRDLYLVFPALVRNGPKLHKRGRRLS